MYFGWRDVCLGKIRCVFWGGEVRCVAGVGYGHKKRVSLIYRTATTAYPCCLPALGEFCRSWSYMTYPGTKVRKFINIPNEK